MHFVLQCNSVYEEIIYNLSISQSEEFPTTAKLGVNIVLSTRVL